ncbi:hypothetical protein [Burkholderia sp. BCC0397]|uniref:hypothetical protein n=1 Tax=Burkholderia sp. BCC0397 TaxID=486876 RepID=UPI00158AE509|nr:hypothetical protein [Burkholderia sp. BCC0397]
MQSSLRGLIASDPADISDPSLQQCASACPCRLVAIHSGVPPPFFSWATHPIHFIRNPTIEPLSSGIIDIEYIGLIPSKFGIKSGLSLIFSTTDIKPRISIHRTIR